MNTHEEGVDQATKPNTLCRLKTSNLAYRVSDHHFLEQTFLWGLLLPYHPRHLQTEKHLGCSFFLAWINARCPPKPLCLSSSSAGQGGGNMMKGSRVETRTGRNHSPVTVMDKTD